MQKWLISANGRIYDHAEAFKKWGYIDWRQNRTYAKGDEVYIYCTKPVQKIVYKTVVDRTGMSFSEITDDEEYWKDKSEYIKAQSGKYARMRLIGKADDNGNDLSLGTLMNRNLLSAAPQGPIRMSDQLAQYVDNFMKEINAEPMFPDEDVLEEYREGNVKTVQVNKYERNASARQKCLEYYGNKYQCLVCGFDFEKRYGEVGKQFIHVHHIVPLNEIGKEYVIDAEKDLIPVCPNCHAMLHRKLNGKRLSPSELKKIVSDNSK